jgi:hypothetical protein
MLGFWQCPMYERHVFAAALRDTFATMMDASQLEQSA